MARHIQYEDLVVFVADAVSGDIVASRPVRYTVPINICLARRSRGLKITAYDALLSETTDFVYKALRSQGLDPPSDAVLVRYDRLSSITRDAVLRTALHVMWAATGQAAFFLCSHKDLADLQNRQRPPLGELTVQDIPTQTKPDDPATGPTSAAGVSSLCTAEQTTDLAALSGEDSSASTTSQTSNAASEQVTSTSIAHSPDATDSDEEAPSLHLARCNIL
ncbi:uncharacterized protein LTHEOB_3065 [Lasiodiplodia theobromae]|uniref:Uncharacterized protein n=1 Tax=Lasiodiplodia theobromae TaxID=45133 RepID=A0A5N5DB96_9PEZI|nr:uncharacterized protein LTHEOB_3065 [Lasiodiplodia theobromae]KAB2575039.1 hypothetical protein DBV05_g6297 [Lasiodiplodia theobromae]KAF4534257.1 hypothetical protein LTHEOB_3065 [Lasiodiplodia theobromae]